jgi:histidine triad (HIT) family protein
MADTIFTKVINKEIPADIVYEDDLSLAFRDIDPQAPVHILIIPKKPIEQLNDAEVSDRELLGHLIFVAHKVAEKEGVAEGYRLVLNNGKGANQLVQHVHFHIMAGRPLAWPPG